MKKIISIILTIGLLLNISVLASNTTSFTQVWEANGITYEKTYLETETETIVTVSSINRIVQSIHDKKSGKVTVYEYDDEQSNTRSSNRNLVSEFTIENNGVEPRRTVVDRYNTTYHDSNYYEYSGSRFGLRYEGSSTGGITIDSGEIKGLRLYKSYLEDADFHAESIIMAGMGFVPRLGNSVTVGAALNSISGYDIRGEEYLDIVTAVLSPIPGLGKFVAVASCTVHVTLYLAEIHNAGNRFDSCKRYFE